MKDILKMTREELLALKPQDYAVKLLSAEEIIHIAATMDAFWRYNYQVVERGRIGKHALLKSGLHSDGFLVSKILLEPENIRLLMAYQLWLCFKRPSLTFNIGKPDYLAGIPDGATKLAEDLGRIMDVEMAPMAKVDGRILITTSLRPGGRLLMVEDFCTKGTGFKEAVTEIKQKHPDIEIMPYELVILNRGGLTKIVVNEIGVFTIVPVVDYRIQEWPAGPETCPLCKIGSIAIKPKVSEENWMELTTSQQLLVNFGRDDVDQFFRNRFLDEMNS